MKIVHLVSAKEWGGGEEYVMSLACEQRKRGHDVEIISANRPEVINKYRDAGFKVYVMQIHGHFNPLSPFRIANIFRESADETVIHVHRISDTPLVRKALQLLSKNTRPKFICTHHLIEPARRGRKYDKTYSMIDGMICVSQKSKDTLLSSSPSIAQDKVYAILNSTKKDFGNYRAKAANEKSNDTINLLFAGRIYPEKGVDTIIEALPMIKKARLTICGKGDEKYTAQLRDMATQLGVKDRIEWAGFSSNINEYITKSDIGLIPSRWEEPCALVNFEFLASGIPIVSSNTGGQPEIITDGIEGFLVSPNDPKAFAAAVNRLIDDPELRIKMSKAARKTFEDRFTYDNFYKQVMDVYANS